MKFDSTLSFALILTVASIFVPFFTAIVNNIYTFRIKKMEMYEQSKRNSLENFINAVSSLITLPVQENYKFYYSSLNNLYIYFDISDVKILKELDYQIDNYSINDDSTNIQKNLNKITVILSKQIKKK